MGEQHRQVQRWIALIWLVLSGCDEARFTERQPVDAKDLKTFPRAFQGEWHDEKSKFSMIFDATRVSGSQREAIFNGVHSSSPLDTVRASKGLSNPVKSLKVRAWYESFNRVDTLTNYIVKGNLLYVVEKQDLVGVAKFEKSGDSLVVAKIPSLELGENVYIRKLNDTTYMFNLRYSKKNNEEIEYGATWWCPILVELSKGRMYVSLVNKRIDKSPDLIASFGGIDYFDSRWSARTVLRLRDSLFERRDRNGPFLIRSKSK